MGKRRAMAGFRRQIPGLCDSAVTDVTRWSMDAPWVGRFCYNPAMPVPSFAAVDLGSNSFHLVVARLVDGELQVIDRLRERVQLAAGLDENDHLQEGAQQRALACLQRFGQRLDAFHPEHVRVVGTSTLRRAVNSEAFQALALGALGHPIETISGVEEARLIYLGVTHGHDDGGEQRLVVDIGGGSTECIVGVGEQIVQSDSLEMGCVRWSRRFFADGRLTPKAMGEAIIAARLELGPVQRVYRTLGFRQVHGSSGTINAIRTILLANQWAEHSITLEGLKQLEAALLKAGHVDALELPGLGSDRAPVIAGGLAILRAVFEGLRITEMHAAKGALREGVLYDLVGRGGSQDVRAATVARMQARFAVDGAQADRVRALALEFLSQVPEVANDRPEAALYLGWAASLHEVGKVVSYAGHHRHGAYLVQHAEMSGFSYRDHALLAALILSHRRRIDRAAILALGSSEVDQVVRLVVLLRLAVCFNRTRSPTPRTGLRLSLQGPRAFHIELPPGWLDERPLTRADLEEEAKLLRDAGLTLTWSQATSH
jgi:exopolyphosphatase/guanosine-5'-triphosphate,3'-diphosphate pyrophosphatase